MKNQKEHIIIKILLITTLLFQGISALFGGIALIIDPSGAIINLDIRLLSNSPFNDYLIPGLFLFSILGVYPLVLLYSYLKKRQWTRYGLIILGIALSLWILIEILLIGYIEKPPLQLIYGLAGLLILILGLIIYHNK